MKNFKNETLYDEALILKKSQDFYVGISKNHGKVFFASSGISKKYSSLNKNFYIKYNLEKFYNSNKKIIIYPDNIELDSFISNSKFISFSHFLNFFLLEFHLSGIPNEKVWKILDEIRNNININVEELLKFFVLIFLEICDFIEKSFLRKAYELGFFENFSQKNFLEFKSLLEKDLEKIFTQKEKIIFSKNLLSQIFI